MPGYAIRGYPTKTKKRAKKPTDGTKALKIVRQIASAREVKYKDIVHINNTISNGTVFQLVPAIAQGDQIDQMSGQSYQLKNIKIKGLVNATTGNYGYIRLIIIRTNAFVDPASLAVTDVLDSSSIYSLYKEKPTLKYTVISDVTRRVNDDVAHEEKQVLWNKNLKVNKVHTIKSITSIKNNYSLLYIHNFSGAFGALNANVRVYFTDS